MREFTTNEIINLLLNKETEILQKFYNTISEILRLGYETERGKEQLNKLIESIEYSLDDIKAIH